MNPAIPESTSEHARLFIAIPVSPEIKTRLEQKQTALRNVLTNARVTWTRPEQLHLTLSFLGNVELKRLDALIDALCPACRTFSPITLHAERLGVFPDFRFPRVIWVSVHDEENQLISLQHSIAQAVQPFTSEAPEKNFTGHITLARIKRIQRGEAKQLATLASMPDKPFGSWTATAIHLFRSELSSEGARHTEVTTVALASSSTSD